MELTRYWINFDWPPDENRGTAFGFGVTAYSREDAIQILRQEYFDRFDRPMPTISEVTEDVDVATLDAGHVLPNMDPPVWRGVWYPRLMPLR